MSYCTTESSWSCSFIAMLLELQNPSPSLSGSGLVPVCSCQHLLRFDFNFYLTNCKTTQTQTQSDACNGSQPNKKPTKISKSKMSEKIQQQKITNLKRKRPTRPFTLAHTYQLTPDLPTDHVGKWKLLVLAIVAMFFLRIFLRHIPQDKLRMFRDQIDGFLGELVIFFWLTEAIRFNRFREGH